MLRKLSTLFVALALMVGAASAQVGTIFPGPGTPNLSNFLMFDAFAGTAGVALNGRVPPKGPTWQASGTGAANGIAGAGIMQQTVGGGLVLYGFQQHAQVPRRYSCTWTYPSGTVNPPTYAITQTAGTSGNFLHGEQDPTSFFIRLGTVTGPTFTFPAWAVATSYTLSPGVQYQSELNYDGGTNASMVLRNATTGAVLGNEVAHDPLMASYVGNWTFAETLDNVLQFNTCYAQATTSYSFPTLNTILETTFPTNAAGFVGDPAFGGTATFNSAGSMTIAGSAFPAGGGIPLAALAINDTIFVSMDVSAETGCTGGNPCAFSIVGAAGSPITAIQPFPATAGRTQFNFTITTADASPRFLVTGPSAPGGIAFSVTLSQFNMYKNTPATPPTPPAYPP